MKKTIAALSAILSAAVFAGADDLLVMFSTPGPDKYADGSTVLDNECYSLVWTAADGTQTRVITVPAAKEGKCTPILFAIDEGDIAKYRNGSWGVYLLDTRDFAKDASGKTLAALDGTGQPTVVNVAASVAEGIASKGSMNNASSSSSVTAGSYDLAAANVPRPRVTGIEIVGANVVVTVKDTVPFVGYTLQSGDDVTNFSVPAGATSASGNAASEIKLVTPKKDGAQFFKVSTIQ
jgi:hypothetical protein